MFCDKYFCHLQFYVVVFIVVIFCCYIDLCMYGMFVDFCDCIIYIMNSGASEGLAGMYGNCTTVFNTMDANNNSFVGLHEVIVALIINVNEWAFDDSVESQLKLQQINCSFCLHDKVDQDEDFVTIYYM